jgi:hypothetical protein
MCAQYNPTKIRYFQNFKTYNDELYALEFPDEWMTSHKEGTGPVECFNCMDYASWRGVCIGYCPNCAGLYEGFSRGPGFYDKAVEYKQSDIPVEKSAYNTYLKGVSLENIGDIEFNPLHTMDAHAQWKETYEMTLEDTEDHYDSDSKNDPSVNHILFQDINIFDELKRNKNIKVGDTIEYSGYNQMSWEKYLVIYKNGKKNISIIDSYYMKDARDEYENN